MDLYSYTKNTGLLKKMIIDKESFSYVGLPYIGKTRILKSILAELNMLEDFEIINTRLLLVNGITNVDIKQIVNNLEESYLSGKKIFTFTSIPLEDELSPELYSAISKFRDSKVVRPQIIMLPTSDPIFYPAILKVAPRLFDRKIYENISTPDYFKFYVKQNSQRYNLELASKELSELAKQSGNIALIIKEFFRIMSSEGIITVTEVIKRNLLESGVQQFLNELTNFDKNLFIRVINKSTITEQETEYLSKVGATKANGELSSLLIANNLQQQDLSLSLVESNGTTYLNGKSLADTFSVREMELLRLLITNRIVTREKIASILNSNKGVDEVASESAIDKVMSRIRSKLFNLGFSKEIIQAKKGSGYIISAKS